MRKENIVGFLCEEIDIITQTKEFIFAHGDTFIPMINELASAKHLTHSDKWSLLYDKIQEIDDKSTRITTKILSYAEEGLFK